MATDFLNDARREIEGRTKDFCEDLIAFYRGDAEAEQSLMKQTTQPFWQSLRLSGKRLKQRGLAVDLKMQEQLPVADYDGPKKDGYDYTCRRTDPVKMRRIYYRNGKKIAHTKNREIAVASFLKADVQGDMAICPNCGHEGKLSSYIDGCDACGAKFLVSDFETKVSGFSLEEDMQNKSIRNFVKAFVTVGITALSLVLLAILAGGIMFLLLALGKNGFHAVQAAAIMLMGVSFAPAFFQSLFFMFLIFIMMLIIMELHRRPGVQDEAKVKTLIPTFSTEDFLQNLEYQLRMIHMADSAEKVRFFANCDLEQQVANYQDVVDCCICGLRFLDAQTVGNGYRIRVEVRERLTLDTGRKIRNRYEKIRLELEGRREILEGSSKPLREYKCPNCGGSVDILGGAVCEYCNTAVDYGSFGWLITSYANLGKPENPFAKILAGALGIYAVILIVCLAAAAHSDNGKETLELWENIRLSAEYLKEIQKDMILPDAISDDCKETASSETDFSVKKEYACEDREAVKEAYHAALLERGFLEMQKYPEGFSVFKIEDPSQYTEDPEDGMFYLEIRTEDSMDGIAVTITLLDENWEPVQE